MTLRDHNEREGRRERGSRRGRDCSPSAATTRDSRESESEREGGGRGGRHPPVHQPQ